MKILRAMWWPISAILRLVTYVMCPLAGLLWSAARGRRRRHRQLVRATTASRQVVVHRTPAPYYTTNGQKP